MEYLQQTIQTIEFYLSKMDGPDKYFIYHNNCKFGHQKCPCPDLDTETEQEINKTIQFCFDKENIKELKKYLQYLKNLNYTRK